MIEKKKTKVGFQIISEKSDWRCCRERRDSNQGQIHEDFEAL